MGSETCDRRLCKALIGETNVRSEQRIFLTKMHCVCYCEEFGVFKLGVCNIKSHET
jgi:hypothetical protein